MIISLVNFGWITVRTYRSAKHKLWLIIKTFKIKSSKHGQGSYLSSQKEKADQSFRRWHTKSDKG